MAAVPVKTAKMAPPAEEIKCYLQKGRASGNIRLKTDGQYSFLGEWSSVNDVYPRDISTDEAGSFTMTETNDSEVEVAILPVKKIETDDNVGEVTVEESVPEPWGFVMKKQDDEEKGETYHFVRYT